MLLSIREACQELKVGKSKLYEWISTGFIKTVRFPDTNRRLIPRTEIERIIQEFTTLEIEKTPSEDEAKGYIS